jgi:hypothetical protein
MFLTKEKQVSVVRIFRSNFSRSTILVMEFVSILCCLFSILLGLWAIDVSASSMLMEAQLDVEIFSGNGWHFRRAVQHYHIGIYLVLAGMAILCILCIVMCVEKSRMIMHPAESGS